MNAQQLNIYLDIDGVLLINEKHAAPYADELIAYVLDNFPGSVHWLTTHCWQGENRTHEVLSPVLSSQVADRLHEIKPTDWGEYKTDAIDFSRPFVWLDDDLYDEERTELARRDTLDSFVHIDLAKDSHQLKKVLDMLQTHSGN